MNHLEKIGELCSQNVTGLKILIIPNISLKTQIFKRLNDYGINPINLKAMTIGMLVDELVERKVNEQELVQLNPDQVIEVFGTVLRKLKDEKKITFFSRLEITSGLCKTISKTILELGLAGYYEGKSDLSHVINPEKKHDIEIIISEYEKYKTEKKYIDQVDKCRLALKTIKTKDEMAGISKYILHPCYYGFLEKEMLIKLGFDCKEETYKYDWNSDEKITNATEIKFVKAYGRNLEAKEVIRDIIHNKYKFDDIAIVATLNDPYAQSFYQMMQTYTFENNMLEKDYYNPMTFGQGLPLTLGTPTKLLLSLLQWIENGYKAHDFINLFSTGNMDLDDSEDVSFGRMAVINCIKKSGLKWNRNTYLKTFEEYLKRLEAVGEKKMTDGADITKNNSGIESAKWIIQLLVTDLFPNIPEEKDGRVDVEKLLLGLKKIVSKRRKIVSELDGTALSAIRYELTGILGERIVPTEEAIRIIRGDIFNMRIRRESIEPGKIHFTTYENVEWLDRKRIYFVGLDANSFPGMLIEDPVLLDCERTGDLKTAKEVFYRKLETMDRALKSILGSVVFSYPYYDTVENRRMAPSTIFNRLYEKEHVEDESKIITRDFLVTIDNCLDEEDYFIHHGIVNGPILKDNDRVNANANMRLRANADFNFSPSAFKTYLNCEYSFFLKYVLGLKDIADEKIDVLGWLSHFEIGHVYHKIFEEFCRRYKIDNRILCNEGNAKSVIREIAASVINEYEEILPSGSVHKVKVQTEEILNNCEMFADKEADNVKMLEPVAFEHEFGRTNLCEITLNDGTKIKINGIIDRIDKRKGKNEYIISDYKTGSTYGYNDLENAEELVVNEQSIQLMVYYLAMKKEYNIVGTNYRFVTSKGDYKTIDIPIDADSERLFIQIISEIIDKMRNGEFSPKAVGNAGSVCDYCGFLKSCIYASKETEAQDE